MKKKSKRNRASAGARKTVEVYLSLLKLFGLGGDHACHVGGPTAGEMWLRLRNARLIHFDPSCMTALKRSWRKWVIDKLDNEEVSVPASMLSPNKLFESDYQLSDEENEYLDKLISMANEELPFDPGHLPFDCSFFGFGAGVEIPFWEIAGKIPTWQIARDSIGAMRIIGYVLTHDGFVIEITERTSHLNRKTTQLRDIPDAVWNEDAEVSWIVLREPFKEWVDTSSSAWVVTGLLECINAFRQVVVGHGVDFETRRKWKSASKGMPFSMPIPKPFYEVKLRDSMVRNVEKALATPKQPPSYGHRWDVRSHERLLCQRRQRPLKPSDRTKWESRGWTVYDGDLPEAIAEEIWIRNWPKKRDDEWIAIKRSWIDSYKKGDENRPQVPAVRIVDCKRHDKGWLADAEKEACGGGDDE